VGLLLVMAAGATTAPQADEKKAVVPIDRLLSKKLLTRNRAVNAILRDRQSVIEQLIPLIDPANAEKYPDETRVVAAYLLGELRAVEAVPVLSQVIADPPGPRYVIDGSRYDYPVTTALVKIGRPAVPAMIKNLETSDDRAVRGISLGVLSQILGGKRGLLALLTKLIEQSDDKDVTRRLRAARTKVEVHYKEDSEPLY
jgi:HEAT repeat protein